MKSIDEQERRTRNIQKPFRVTEEENELIMKRMELAGYDNLNEYLVRMAIDGFIIVQDYDNFIEVSKQLQNDFEDVVNSYCQYYNVDRDRAFAEISQSITEDKLHSVSDLFGALSNNKYVGRYRRATDYWKNNPNALEQEAFAHFYEATIRNDVEKLNAIKQTFPNAYKIFEDMLRI